MRRTAVLLAVTLVMALGAGVGSAHATPSDAAGRARPPHGVYTCSWISAHPRAAALARVSCDPAWRPTGTGSASAPARPYASGCQPIPNGGGNIGTGVFAWSTYEYANYWDWSYPSGGGSFTWYLQKTDGTNYASNTTNAGGSITVQPNVYRWGVQNHGDVPQRWTVCYDVV